MNHFFQTSPPTRRRMTLESFSSKKNAQGERRLRLDFEMPLTGEPTDSLPDTLARAYELLDENQDVTKGLGFADVKGQNLKLYHLPEKVVGRPQESTAKLVLTGCDLNSVQMYRIVEEERTEADIRLFFTLTASLSKELLDWARHNLGATVYGEFETAQPELVADGKAAATGERDEEEDGENFIEEKFVETGPENAGNFDAPAKSDPSLTVTKRGRGRPRKSETVGVH